jgi:hypothetical protein
LDQLLDRSKFDIVGAKPFFRLFLSTPSGRAGISIEVREMISIRRKSRESPAKRSTVQRLSRFS